MFMALEPLAGLMVVDLYAGSGALGIEALSRGASVAHFFERDRAALEALRSNLETLGLEARGRIWPQALPGALERWQGEWRAVDLVLADPPYGGAEAREILRRLGLPERLRSGARVVIEHHTKDELPEQAGGLTRVRERKYGETTVSTYRADEAPANARELS
jgi:16S rRNA (guanine(966)-N(2))-methyltransferase RsmD